MSKEELLAEAFEAMYTSDFKTDKIHRISYVDPEKARYKGRFLDIPLNHVSLYFEHWDTDKENDSDDDSDDSYCGDEYHIYVHKDDIFWNLDKVFYWDCYQLSHEDQEELMYLYKDYCNGRRRIDLIDKLIK